MEEVFINAKLGAALLKRTSNLLQRNRLESTPVLNVKGSGKE